MEREKLCWDFCQPPLRNTHIVHIFANWPFTSSPHFLVLNYGLENFNKTKTVDLDLKAYFLEYVCHSMTIILILLF